MKAVKYAVLMVLMLAAILLFNRMKEEDNGDENNITIAFYNVENLFDTSDDPHSNDNDFLPSSDLKWNHVRYGKKLENLSTVIEKLGDQDGPEVLGVSEVENSKVLDDLLNTSKLKSRHYKYVHKESGDRRGIDVALIYKSTLFKPFVSRAIPIIFPNHRNVRTRSILLVGGKIEKDTLFFLVNHWPSRRGGEKSVEQRATVALNLRNIADSLLHIHKSADLIMMGDFNDEPGDRSIKSILRAEDHQENQGSFYNPFLPLSKEGKGTIKYKGTWSIYDQILLSRSLMHDKSHHYIQNSAKVYDPVWMYYKENRKSGPWRTYSGKKYYGGYSDHFPVFIQLSK